MVLRTIIWSFTIFLFMSLLLIPSHSITLQFSIKRLILYHPPLSQLGTFVQSLWFYFHLPFSSSLNLFLLILSDSTQKLIPFMRGTRCDIYDCLALNYILETNTDENWKKKKVDTSLELFPRNPTRIPFCVPRNKICVIPLIS